MNCQQIRTLLHAHHDGELDVAHTLEFEQHLADCPQCFARVRQLDSLSGVLRDESLRHRAPADLAAKLRAALPRPALGDQKVVPGWFGWWRVGLAAAALVLACFTLNFQVFRKGEDPLVAELLSSHVRSLMATHLTDVASTDQHTVKPWFDGKLDFAPPVKDLRESGFPLIGGRLDYIATRPVAALVYGRQKHFINLFVWPQARPSGTEEIRATESHGYHFVQWSGQGMNFWAVSDLNEKELTDFARLLREK